MFILTFICLLPFTLQLIESQGMRTDCWTHFHFEEMNDHPVSLWVSSGQHVELARRCVLSRQFMFTLTLIFITNARGPNVKISYPISIGRIRKKEQKQFGWMELVQY